MNISDNFKLDLAGGIKSYSRSDWEKTRLGLWVPPTGVIRAELTIYVKNASHDANHHAWRAAIARAYGHCETCYEQTKLEAHHLHYRTVGNESLWDFLMLCRKCHFAAHRPARFRGERWIEDPERYQAELWVDKLLGTRRQVHV